MLKTKDFGLGMERDSECSEVEFSIIVPTYNRAEDLKDLLLSILQQTKLPKEVIIIDDSENSRTAALIEQVREYLFNKQIALKYVHNMTRSSTSTARNLGITHARGEVLLFLDDDVVLRKDYLEEMRKTYKNYPKAVGIQGYITNTPKLENFQLKLRNQLRKMFFLYCLEKDRCRVLPSGENTYPSQVSRVIECQWLAGCNQSFKSKALIDNKFDENLKKYSFLEDVDLSYSVLKKHPNSLYMTPHAILYHKWSKAQRLSPKLLTYIQTINRTYFFYKHFRQSYLGKLIFIWSNVGRVMFLSLMLSLRAFSLKRPVMFEIGYVAILIRSYIYALKHLEEIKMGNLKFLDKMLN